MAESARLIAEPFDETKLDKVQSFDCGSDDWERAINAWIRGHGEKSVLWSMREKRTRVWLFWSRSDLIGFGSLGETRTRWPPPAGAHANIAFIPMMAVQVQFKKQPPGLLTGDLK